MASSLLLKTVRRVTSRTLPSAKWARTASCCQRAGACRTRGPGKTSSFVRAGRWAGSSRSPSVSQVAHGLSRRESAGPETLAALVRHPAQGLLIDQAGVRSSRSCGGRALAGQLQVVGGGVVTAQAQLETAPAAGSAVTGAALQPPTFSAAIRPWRKLVGSGLAVSLTVTGSRMLRAPALMSRDVVPSFRPWTIPPGPMVHTSLGQWMSQNGVRSRRLPSW